jgi:hypothetical protein
MKKITLLLALFLSFSVFSQDSDVAVSIKNKEGINFDQYDLIKDVNRLYPDILVSKFVINNYKTNLKTKEIVTADFVYDIPADCKFYYVTIDNGGYSLTYSYSLLDGTLITGNIRKFNGQFFRMLYKSLGEKRTVQYYIDGKLINEVKN